MAVHLTHLDYYHLKQKLFLELVSVELWRNSLEDDEATSAQNPYEERQDEEVAEGKGQPVQVLDPYLALRQSRRVDGILGIEDRRRRFVFEGTQRRNGSLLLRSCLAEENGVR